MTTEVFLGRCVKCLTICAIALITAGAFLIVLSLVTGCAAMGWHVPNAGEQLRIIPERGEIIYSNTAEQELHAKDFEAHWGDGKSVKFGELGRSVSPAETYRGFADFYARGYNPFMQGLLPGGVPGIIQSATGMILPATQIINGRVQQGFYVPTGMQWIPAPVATSQPVGPEASDD